MLANDLDSSLGDIGNNRTPNLVAGTVRLDLATLHVEIARVDAFLPSFFH